MKIFVKKLPSHINGGWWNWYVIIPKDNPLYWKHYDNIDVEVHWWLTFSEDIKNMKSYDGWKEFLKDEEEGWAVGFDTAHAWDDKKRWTKEAVEVETLSLLTKLISLSYKNENR